jgi:hypothetical protein
MESITKPHCAAGRALHTTVVLWREGIWERLPAAHRARIGLRWSDDRSLIACSPHNLVLTYCLVQRVADAYLEVGVYIPVLAAGSP